MDLGSLIEDFLFFCVAKTKEHQWDSEVRLILYWGMRKKNETNGGVCKHFTIPAKRFISRNTENYHNGWFFLVIIVLATLV